MFLNSVSQHLRSDVPIGITLSGGLDSSAIVCAVRLLEPEAEIHTFTYVDRSSNQCEESWADVINEHVKAIPHKVIVEPDELMKDLDDLVRHQGEPFGTTSIYAQYKVFEAVRQVGIKVTLDGQGADEIFAGYHGYPSEYVKSLREQGKIGEIVKFLNNWRAWPSRTNAQALKLLTHIILNQRHRELLSRFFGVKGKPMWLRETEYAGPKSLNADPNQIDQVEDEAIGRRLVEALRRDMTCGGLLGLLRYADRNSMRWSVESRFPFLTTDVAEFALSLPEQFLLGPNGETKRVFRAAMRGIVPDAILNRRDKVGFKTPEHRWMSALTYNARSTLSEQKISVLIDIEKAKTALLSAEDKNGSVTEDTWRLLNYCAWMNANFK
jgi:asparagine synthase (glutamine-hydrolysing)